MTPAHRSGITGEAPAAPGGLPLLGRALQLWRRPIAFLESLRTVGDVVRLDLGTWPVHVLTSPELVHTVLVADGRRFGRGHVFDRLRPLFANGLVTTDGEFHRRQRRLIQPAFHRDHITEYARLMCGLAEAMSASWTADREIPVDREMRRFTLSTVAEMTFSGRLGQPAVAECTARCPSSWRACCCARSCRRRSTGCRFRRTGGSTRLPCACAGSSIR